MNTSTLKKDFEAQQQSTPSTGSTAGRRRGLPMWVAQSAALALFAAAWELVARHGVIDPLFIGTPTKILRYLYEQLFLSPALVMDTFWTLAGTALAFVGGSLAGIATGLVFVTYPVIEKFCEPFLSALNAMPRIALAPLFLLWFGLGLGSKVALGFSLTYFIVLSSTVAGARSVDRDFLVLARTMGASPSKIFTRITLISAIPTLFSGLRLGLIYSLLGVIAGEIIAAQHGLGQRLSYLAGTFQIDGVFAVLILLAVLGTALMYGMSALEKRLIRWR